MRGVRKLLLRDTESGSNGSNRGGIDAEKKRTENGTLGYAGGNMNRCRRVVANSDSLRTAC